MTRALVAVVALATSVAAGVAGAYLEFGLGWALITACVLLLLVSLLAGWES